MSSSILLRVGGPPLTSLPWTCRSSSARLAWPTVRSVRGRSYKDDPYIYIRAQYGSQLVYSEIRLVISCCLACSMASSKYRNDGNAAEFGSVSTSCASTYCLEGVCVGLRVRGCASLLPFGRPRLTEGAGVGGYSAFCERLSSPSLLGVAALCAISWAFKDSVSETGSIIGHAVLHYRL